MSRRGNATITVEKDTSRTRGKTSTTSSARKNTSSTKATTSRSTTTPARNVSARKTSSKTSLGKKEEKGESLLEWFDKTAEKELNKRKTKPAKKPMDIKNTSGVGHHLVAKSAASAVEIEDDLKLDRNSELADAVEKLAKAEALITFEGAVKAAEAAAAKAPPGKAEEAAVASAKGYQAELTNVIQQSVPGERPIEVIGYVGITRPSFALKTK